MSGLPERPSLVQLKLQARELQQLHRERRQSAAARIAAQHPEFHGRSSQAVLDAPLKLADLQLVIAREHNFESWAAMKHMVETSNRLAAFTPHPRFDDAVAAMDAGDTEKLDRLLTQYPELATARTNLDPPYGYFTGATLLHHVAWNPGRHAGIPANVVDIARLLLDRGADPDAVTLSTSAGTTLGLIITSYSASKANVSGPLIDLLVKRGAKLELNDSAAVIPGWGRRNILDVALSNGAHRAAEKLVELGAKVDVCSAAALGRIDLLRAAFDDDGRLRERPYRRGAQLSERDAIGLALLFAYVNKHPAAVDFLFEKDGNWNMIGVNNGTALHRAAWDGDLAMVKRLVAKGADMSNRDNPFNSTPLSWAQHNKQQEVFDWMVANCKIDLHEAVVMNLLEHVKARIDEDPTSVNRRIDMWDVAQSTPLYWAAWTKIQDNDGEHSWSKESRLTLVRLLLDHGADPNIVAGDGYTALDVARTAGASRIAVLLQERGGKSTSEL